MEKTIKWRPHFLDNRYEFSTDGRVRRCIELGVYAELKPRDNGDGHLYVQFGRKTIYVHSAMLELFVCPRPAGLEALHIDDDPANNRLANLMWGTHQQNHQQAILNGSRTGEIILTPDVVRKMRAEFAAGKSQCQIARERGLKRCTARDAINRRTWAWVE